MTHKIYYLIILTMLFGCSAKVNESLKYLKQKPPSMVPEVFAPDLISSKNNQEFGSVFSKDGTEFFYGVNVNNKAEIRYAKLIGDEWTEPQTILSHEKYGFNDPFLSTDEKRLYFISEMSIDGLNAKDDIDIWYVEKNKTGWSEPINAGPSINSEKNEFYISFTQDGTMYFSSNVSPEGSSNFDIYRSKSVEGKFQKAESLGDSVNSPHYEADVFVDPHESYIIFYSQRPGKPDLRGGLYISFKKNNDTWTKAVKIDEPINGICPFISKDGKYFFYSRNGDIYWVDAKIIEQYRK